MHKLLPYKFKFIQFTVRIIKHNFKKMLVSTATLYTIALNIKIQKKNRISFNKFEKKEPWHSKTQTDYVRERIEKQSERKFPCRKYF